MKGSGGGFMWFLEMMTISLVLGSALGFGTYFTERWLASRNQ